MFVFASRTDLCMPLSSAADRAGTLLGESCHIARNMTQHCVRSCSCASVLHFGLPAGAACLACLFCVEHLAAMVKRTNSSVSLKVKQDTPTKAVQSPCKSWRPANQPQQIEAQCSLAKRVPKVKPTSDLRAYNNKIIQRNSLIRIIDRLHNAPEEAVHVWQAIENGTIGDQGDGVATDSPFFKSCPKRVADLEVEFIAGFIIKATGGAVTKDALDILDGADDSNLMHLFSLATATTKRTPLPPACHHKGFCMRLAMSRYSQVGKRLAKLKSHITAAGTIDWMKFACYTLSWAGEGEELLQKVKHISTVEATVPAHWRVTKAFLLKDPWYDVGCTMHIKGCEYQLVELFEDGVGPREFQLDKKGTALKELALVVEHEMDEAEKQVKHAEHSEEVVLKKHDEKMMAKRQTALQTARKKLEAEQSARKGLALR